MRPECHEREQAEQSWRCACDGWIGPLALTFDAQVAPNFGKRHLNRPAPDKPTEDIDWIGFDIGAQECLRPEFASKIADQDIADRHKAPGMMPQSSARDDLDNPLAPSIPAGYLDASPAGLRIG